jgi:hypothetical protein
MYDTLFLLAAVALTPDGSSTVFARKQYTEQHNQTEYTERNIHTYDNKNT